jgi:transcriptional regulator with XRE-family HTH domain
MTTSPTPPLAPDDGNLATRIGARLRDLRQSKGLTLSALSAVSGVSVSYLSAVEKGVNLPSLQKLGTITAALGVGLPYVLAEEGEAQLKRAELPGVPGTVDAAHPELLLRVALVRATAGDEGSCPVPWLGRAVFAFVREGELEVTVDGEVFVLAAGDALEASEPETAIWRARTESLAVWTSCPSRLG